MPSDASTRRVTEPCVSTTEIELSDPSSAIEPEEAKGRVSDTAVGAGLGAGVAAGANSGGIEASATVLAGDGSGVDGAQAAPTRIDVASRTAARPIRGRRPAAPRSITARYACQPPLDARKARDRS